MAVASHLCENFGSRLCDVVVDEAIEWKADLIVIGSHGRRGMRRLIIGTAGNAIALWAAGRIVGSRAG